MRVSRNKRTSEKSLPKVAVIGSVGVPGIYGGFETLAENLVRFNTTRDKPVDLTVYCSNSAYKEHPLFFMGARLVYMPLKANGIQSIPYDILSMISAAWKRHDQLLVLGVSGCLFLPVIKLFSRIHVVTNVDGIEWRREKWKGLAKQFLRLSERLAVRYSDVVIADNKSIAEYLFDVYECRSQVIAYGGDHALVSSPAPIDDLALPKKFALGLSRIEPENNVDMILDSFSKNPTERLVFVGNWDASPYGRSLRATYTRYANIDLVDPVYEAGRLRSLRDRAWLYVHGHSAGGTNPSLVEMMHFNIPVVAFDCRFNRHSTKNQALFFATPEELQKCVSKLHLEGNCEEIGNCMQAIARDKYNWASIGKAYFELIGATYED